MKNSWQGFQRNLKALFLFKTSLDPGVFVFQTLKAVHKFELKCPILKAH